MQNALQQPADNSALPEPTSDSLLTYDQLAIKLGMTRRGLECLVRSRKIPAFKLGHRTIRFSYRRVLEALTKRELKSL